MKIQLVENNNNWNKFILKQKGSFLQAFEWGELQEKSLKKVWRWEVLVGDRKILMVQVIKERSGLLNYLYIPYGPVFSLDASADERHAAFNLFLEEIKKLALKEGIAFLRIESCESLPEVVGFKMVKALKRSQPLKTMVLDIDKPTEDLLNSFHNKTRYNIRLAEKKGVVVNITDKYLPTFYDLMLKTKERQSFTPHAQDHYIKLFLVNSEDFKVKMFLAKYKDEVITASIRVFFGDRVTALHTGTNYIYRNLKSMELLHWQAMLLAKELGYKSYDFWGLDEVKFPGVTKFKKRFNGQEITYPLGVDIIFNKVQYKIYKILRKLAKCL